MKTFWIALLLVSVTRAVWAEFHPMGMERPASEVSPRQLEINKAIEAELAIHRTGDARRLGTNLLDILKNNPALEKMMGSPLEGGGMTVTETGLNVGGVNIDIKDLYGFRIIPDETEGFHLLSDATVRQTQGLMNRYPGWSRELRRGPEDILAAMRVAQARYIEQKLQARFRPYKEN